LAHGFKTGSIIQVESCKPETRAKDKFRQRCPILLNFGCIWRNYQIIRNSIDYMVLNKEDVEPNKVRVDPDRYIPPMSTEILTLTIYLLSVQVLKGVVLAYSIGRDNGNAASFLAL
jgi:hypothetical protein